jgi:hypothetical protein
MRSTLLHNISRQVSRLALLALVVVPVACDDDDPSAPTLVAAENAVVPITAASYAALVDETFTIPNGGGALAPELAGQTIELEFGLSGNTRTATITVPGGTITTTVDFGSCKFKVTGVQPAGAFGIRIIPGLDFLDVDPCSFSISTSGQLVGTTSSVNVSVLWNTITSAPRPYQVSIGSDGTLTLTDKSGGTVQVGRVTLTPVSG